jgi:hypothetical protein
LAVFTVRVGSLRPAGVIAIAVCFVFLAAVPAQSACPDGCGQKFALLVGVSDYDPVCTYGDLTYSHKDALDMYDLLVEAQGWDPSHVRLLLNSSATAQNIVDGISWLSEMCSDQKGTALIFFSGHGSFFCDNHAVRDWDEPTDECIMPFDGDSHLVQNVIIDDAMGDMLDTIGSARTILILDSCYSGGFIPDVGDEGRLILASCGEREMCWEGVETGKVQVKNGLYTHCLLEAFAGAGDSDGDGTVSVEEAGAYAIERVQDFTPDVLPEMYDGVECDTYL